MEEGKARASPTVYTSIRKQKNDAVDGKQEKDISPVVAITQDNQDKPEKKKPKVPVSERKPVARPKSKAKTEQDAVRIEINQLKIRFPDLVEKKDDGQIVLDMTVPVLDPDFPFDLESVQLRICIPMEYPKVSSPAFQCLNPDIPENLKNQFKSHMDRAAKTLMGQEALRPMIRFLEKNLELMLTPPANPSGFKFIAPTTKTNIAPRVVEPPKVEYVEYRKDDSHVDDLDMPPEFYEAMKHLRIEEKEQEEYSSSITVESRPIDSLPLKRVPESRFQPGEYLKIEPISKTALAGTVQFQFHDSKLKGIGLLVITQLGVLLKCDRCKMSTPLEDLRPDMDRIYSCKKCNSKCTAHFKFDVIHESNKVAGYIRCKGGLPADILPSTIQVTCSHCTPDDPYASTVKVEKVQIGEPILFNCKNCHRQCSFEIGRVDWVHIAGLLPEGRPKRGAIPKLPSQIGEPLPDRGACKHFRKSFRWFRFPCCGKAYPCEECHNEDPSNGGHKAEWASRQICGCCSRELPISQKECACGAEPASTRHSAHWEGGKGMRDQTQMSKKDNKKYRNLTKTAAVKK